MKSLIILFMSLSIGYSNEISHNDVLNICNNTCVKYSNNVCIKKGYRDCTLLSAIIMKESSYNTRSFNPEKTGSYGLMQIQCATAKDRGLTDCKDLFKPEQNIKIGIKHLIWLEDIMNTTNMDDLLSAYNAGVRKQGLVYGAIKCNHNNSFDWGKNNKVFCFKNEYINQEYVWQVKRAYKFLGKK